MCIRDRKRPLLRAGLAKHDDVCSALASTGATLEETKESLDTCASDLEASERRAQGLEGEMANLKAELDRNKEALRESTGLIEKLTEEKENQKASFKEMKAEVHRITALLETSKGDVDKNLGLLTEAKNEASAREAELARLRPFEEKAQGLVEIAVRRRGEPTDWPSFWCSEVLAEGLTGKISLQDLLMHRFFGENSEAQIDYVHKLDNGGLELIVKAPRRLDAEVNIEEGITAQAQED